MTRKITSASGRIDQTRYVTAGNGFQTSTILTGTGSGNGQLLNSTANPLPNSYLLLSSKKRSPPLIRAMSAPVNTLNTETEAMGKSLFSSGNRRKTRRRKTTNLSLVKVNSPEVVNSYRSNMIGITERISEGRNRKQLTRTRSLAPDVETLVSLLSSEGSDSEKEDQQHKDAYQALYHSGSPLKRPPTLRKTGKSGEDYFLGTKQNAK